MNRQHQEKFKSLQELKSAKMTYDMGLTCELISEKDLHMKADSNHKLGLQIEELQVII